MSETIRGSSGNILDVDSYGGIVPARVVSATFTTVASSSFANVSILANNPSRKGFILANISTSPLFLRFGSTCTSVTYALALAASASTTGSTMLSMCGPVVYTGAITGCWQAANGSVSVMEF